MSRSEYMRRHYGGDTHENIERNRVEGTVYKWINPVVFNKSTPPNDQMCGGKPNPMYGGKDSVPRT